MTVSGLRQEVLNVALAHLLHKRGFVTLPEQFIRSPATAAAPDVLVVFRGLRLAIEGELSDQPQAEQRAWRKATERVEKGIAHISLALLYPADLRRPATFEALATALSERPLRFSVCIPPFPPQPKWHEGDIAALGVALEGAFQTLASEDEVRRVAQLLSEGIKTLASDLLGSGVTAERVAHPLGLSPESIAEAEEKRRRAVMEIAALILTNALLFQEELAKVDHRVKTLSQCCDAPSPHDEFLSVWSFILDAINYYAVFDIARRLMLTLPADWRLDDALRRCVEKVREALRHRAALQHDLLGRLFHLLLGEIAKPLGAYYTSVAAAVLLLRLALAPQRWENLRWDDPAAVARLRVADFACGTGTLLMAALQAITDNFLRAASGTNDLPKQRSKLLQGLLEKGIWGMDVLQSAVHLTATTLALCAPEVLVKGMNLYALDLGVHPQDRTVHLGSLDLLSHDPAAVTLSLLPAKGGKPVTQAATTRQQLQPPPMDLVCMNPPFTRSCGGNLLFGSLPDEEREELQKALQRLLQRRKVKASVTAGLGSVFLALAHEYVKPGGRIAFVLPKALLSGVEWQASRELLAEKYCVETVIVSHDPRRWNFSENTDLSEVLLIARKLPIGALPQQVRKEPTLFVNLWRNPDKPLEALLLAEQLRGIELPKNGRPVPLRLGEEGVGEVIAIPWGELTALPHWLLPCAFAQGELNQTLVSLYRDRSLPLCPLKELGELGPDVRDIFDGFEVLSGDSTPTNFPAFWGHDTSAVTTLQQSPNAYLEPLKKPRKGRPLRDAALLWERAGRVLIVERMRFNTQRLTAVLLTTPVLSASWWAVKLQRDLDEDAAKALVLWLNSTLGLLLLIGNRAETEGAWVKFKKPTLSALPVLDVRRLTKKQLRRLARTFDALSDKPLQPLPQLATDAVRGAIDAALSQTLGLPDFAQWRQLLAHEPILTLQPLVRCYRA